MHINTEIVGIVSLIAICIFIGLISLLIDVFRVQIASLFVLYKYKQKIHVCYCVNKATSILINTEIYNVDSNANFNVAASFRIGSLQCPHRSL